MTQTIKVFVVDDEPHARSKIIHWLDQVPIFEVIGEAGTGKAALEGLRRFQPELIFLDIEMPDMNGFEVLSQLPHPYRPQVIFVTAFHQFAVEAFRVAALDYLLKPYDQHRFKESLDRAQRRIKNHDSHQQFETVLNTLQTLTQASGPTISDDRLPVRQNHRTILVPSHEVMYLKAMGKKCQLFKAKQHLTCDVGLGQMEKRLNPSMFCRIHRSYIVNIQHVVEIQEWFWSQYVLILRNGIKLTSGRKYKDRITSLMG